MDELGWQKFQGTVAEFRVARSIELVDEKGRPSIEGILWNGRVCCNFAEEIP